MISKSTFFGVLAMALVATVAYADGIDDMQRLIGSDATAAPIAKPHSNDKLPLPELVIRAKENTALRLTSNKDQLIRLDRDAASVVVNNPDHVSIMLDSPRLMIVMPRQPGTTSFTVLDHAGGVILQKDVIVSNVEPHYVRVRRICAGNDPSCTPAIYYYCPDGCYEVTPVGTAAPAAVPAPAGAAAGAASMAGAAGQAGGVETAPQGEAPAP